MADPLYLSLWFPNFSTEEMLPRLRSVLHQFPFSDAHAGVGFVAVRSVDWSEPLLFQQTFDDRVEAGEALHLAADFLHGDNSYELEGLWDLWTPQPEGPWQSMPRTVRFFAYGTEFADGTWQDRGHIEIDLGLDSPFIGEGAELDQQAQMRIQQNIQKLLDYTKALETHCGLRARLLWSESENNLAQKLIERLQPKQ